MNPLDHGARDEERPQARSRHRADVVVLGDQTVERDARVLVEVLEHGGENRPSNVLEVEVDPVRARRAERAGKIRLAMALQGDDPRRKRASLKFSA